MPLKLNNNNTITIVRGSDERVLSSVHDVRSLSDALGVIEQIDSKSNPDLKSQAWKDAYYGILDMIDVYVDHLEIDFTERLQKNLEYLFDKYDLKWGQVEDKVLGLSTGYLSRTLGRDAPKKMSVQTLIKLSRMFGISMDRLVYDDISSAQDNLKLLMEFIDKIANDTRIGKLYWTLEDETEESDIYDLDQEKENRVTSPSILRGRNRLVLANKVVRCAGVSDCRDLILVPYSGLITREEHYDFLFIDKGSEIGSGLIERVFYTECDERGLLDCKAHSIYEEIRDKLNDVKISANVRDAILGYLGKAGE